MYTVLSFAGVMELVDVVDSKSTGGDTVPVRVRSPAPVVANFAKFATIFLQKSSLTRSVGSSFTKPNPPAQPLAALLPYGCGVPLAGLRWASIWWTGVTGRALFCIKSPGQA